MSVLLKKVWWSFARAFLAVFIPGVIGLGSAFANAVQKHDVHVKTMGWLLLAVLVGAAAAGLRAAQAYFTNVEPGDAAHGRNPFSKKPEPTTSQVVAAEGVVAADKAAPAEAPGVVKPGALPVPPRDGKKGRRR